MGCISSLLEEGEKKAALDRVEKKKLLAVDLTGKKLINTWAAGGIEGRKEGEGEWTEIIFTASSCRGKIITCENNFSAKVVQFEGEGTWTITGSKVNVKWHNARGAIFGEDMTELRNSAELAPYSTLEWNGTRGCSLRWPFIAVLGGTPKQLSHMLLPLTYRKKQAREEDTAYYYGGCEYRGVYVYYGSDAGIYKYDNDYYCQYNGLDASAAVIGGLRMVVQMM
jgi:hypothetical protein